MTPIDIADEMFRLEYGSRLYGTQTPTSDFDYKVIFLPTLKSVLLGKRLTSFKQRFDEAGNVITDDRMPMPAGGNETEFIPFQTFVRDFVAGQTYALEVAWALYARGQDSCAPTGRLDFLLLKTLVENFSTCEVHSMAGFAMKQTFDYVKRGERLAAAEKVLAILEMVQSNRKSFAHVAPDKELRLDHTLLPTGGQTVLQFVASETDLEIGSSINNGRTMATLKLNGREYLETTELRHLIAQIKKLVDSYGHRVVEAAEKKVDYKSLMHAVRVYQQCIELLTTGKLTFPRQNPEELLRVKNAEFDEDELKQLLKDLDARVLELQETSTQRRLTPELRQAAEDFLDEALRKLYDLPLS